MVGFWQPLTLALIPPVWLILYLLHRRRTPPLREVGGLFLWQRASGGGRRSRRIDLSLLLLLLASATIIAALANPWLRQTRPQQWVIVLDASASMAAGSRWARAIEQARAQLDKAQRAVVVRAGLNPTVFGPAPGRDLLATLDALRPGDAGADLALAIRTGQRQLPGAQMLLITDAPPPPGLRTFYLNVADEERNVGITALRPGFVALGNTGPGLWRGSVKINGKPYPIEVPARGFAWRRIEASGDLVAALENGGDLGLDDRSFWIRAHPRIVLPQPRPALLRVFRLLDVRPVPRPPAPLAVRIARPPKTPSIPTLYFTPEGAEGATTTVVDRDPDHPALRGVRLIGSALPLPPPPPPGWKPIAVDGKGRGLIYANGPSLYLPPIESLASMPAFPVLVYNFLAPHLRAVRPLGTDGVLSPQVRANVAYVLESPGETLLPGKAQSILPQGGERRPIGSWFFVAAALVLGLERWLSIRRDGNRLVV